MAETRFELSADVLKHYMVLQILLVTKQIYLQTKMVFLTFLENPYCCVMK